MSIFLLALLLGSSFGAWIYFQLSKRSLDRVRSNLIAAVLAGVFAFIIVLSIAGHFLK